MITIDLSETEGEFNSGEISQKKGNHMANGVHWILKRVQIGRMMNMLFLWAVRL
jgi:hypothetical protein